MSREGRQRGGRGSNQYGRKGVSQQRDADPSASRRARTQRRSLRTQAAETPVVYESGSHDARGGQLHVCGEARGAGSGDAAVVGWGRSRVFVSERATGTVTDAAVGSASGTSTLHVGGKAHGVAGDEATLTVADQATGTAHGRASVTATGHARVVLREQASGVIADHVEAEIADDVELVALGRSRVRARGRSVVWAEPSVEVELTESARRELLPAVA